MVVVFASYSVLLTFPSLFFGFFFLFCWGERREREVGAWVWDWLLCFVCFILSKSTTWCFSLSYMEVKRPYI